MLADENLTPKSEQGFFPGFGLGGGGLTSSPRVR
jgi:hypothetical protein